jgi:hypothetical protein
MRVRAYGQEGRFKQSAQKTMLTARQEFCPTLEDCKKAMAAKRTQQIQ